ncbi:MAG: hypothetical protein CMJ75_19220 [Planctomycetaceae bacterium]|nr:hypothetical protein [Planctomycetaceae bacterium]
MLANGVAGLVLGASGRQRGVEVCSAFGTGEAARVGIDAHAGLIALADPACRIGRTLNVSLRFGRHLVLPFLAIPVVGLLDVFIFHGPEHAHVPLAVLGRPLVGAILGSQLLLGHAARHLIDVLLAFVGNSELFAGEVKPLPRDSGLHFRGFANLRIRSRRLR